MADPMGQLSALWFVSGLTCGALGMFVYLSGRRDRGPVQSIPRQVQETLERFEAHWDGRLTAEIQTQIQAQMQEWRSESGQWHGATYDAIAALSAQLTALTNQSNRAHQTAPLETPVTEPEPALEALPVDPLASDAGIDYRPLNEALGQRHWKTADEETRRCLVLAAGRGDRGWLSLEDWATIPATDLRTIDHLWRYWSGDRYGLWPQWHLWQTCGGDYGSFCDRNGWRQDGEAWLDYEDLWFSSDGAIGHLPTAVWHRRACYGIGADSAGRSLEALLYAYGAAIGAL